MIHMPQFLNQDSRTNPTVPGDIVIGSETNNSVYQPAYYLYNFGYLGMIIPAASIGGNYTFNKLAFYYELDDDPFPSDTTLPTYPNITNQTIKLAHTSSSSFSSNDVMVQGYRDASYPSGSTGFTKRETNNLANVKLFYT